MRRPLIELSLVVWGLIGVISYLNIYLIRLGGVLLLAGWIICWAVCKKFKTVVNNGTIYLLVFIVIIIFVEIINIQFSEVEAYEAITGNYTVSGIVTEVKQYSTVLEDVWVYEEDRPDGHRGVVTKIPKLLVKHKWGMVPTWNVGDEITVNGYVSKFDEARNPGTFSPRKYYNGQGIALFIDMQSGQVTRKAGAHFLAIIGEVRNKLLEKMDALLEEKDSALMKGIILGDDKAIDDKTLESFRMTGIAHILAVSGLHFGILYVFLSGALFRLKCPYKIAVTLALAVMFIFVLIAGGSFSAMRAFAMIGLHVAAVLTGRRYDLLNALGFVAIVSMTFQPFIVWHVGFQLSFWAVFSIGSYMKGKVNFETHNLLVRFKALDLLLFPLFIQIMLTPLMVYHFNRFHIYGLLFNIPTAVLMPFLILSGVVLILLGSLPILGGLLVIVCESFLASLRGIASLVWKLPFNSLVVGSPPTFLVVVFFLGLAVFSLSYTFRRIFFKYRFKVLRYGLLGLIGIVLISIMPVPSPLKVDFLDVGQGDAILIHTKDGQKVLIDAGPEKADIRDILLKQGITRLDAGVLSHPDADHVTGFEEMAGQIEIKTFYYGGLTEKKEVVERLKTLYPKTNFVQLGQGDKLSVGEVSFTVLHPAASKHGTRNMSANNMSLVMLMNYNDKKIMFTGDIEKESEKEILDQYGNQGSFLDVDILKVGHHGSKTSSTPDFIRATSPEYAVIPVGKNNFGHPSSETLKTLMEMGQIEGEDHIYRNDSRGCIRVLLGDEIHVIPWLTYHSQTWYNR